MSSLQLPRFFGWSTSEVALRQIQQKQQQQQQQQVRDRSPRKRDDSLHLWNILGYTKQPGFWLGGGDTSYERVQRGNVWGL